METIYTFIKSTVCDTSPVTFRTHLVQSEVLNVCAFLCATYVSLEVGLLLKAFL